MHSFGAFHSRLAEPSAPIAEPDGRDLEKALVQLRMLLLMVGAL